MDFRTSIIYIGVLVLIMLLARTAEKCDNMIRAKVGCIIIVLVLSFLAGFRNISVGIDTKAYAQMFELKGNLNWVEIGFSYLVKILMFFQPTYTFGFWSVSFITNLFFILGLWNYRSVARFKYTVPIFYVLIFFSTMSGIRQWLAVSIIFFFSKYILSEKTSTVKFLIALVIATSIHTSAIVGLFLITPLVLKKSTTKYSIVLKMLLIVILPFAVILALQMVLSKYGHFLANYNTTSMGLMIPVRLVLMCIISISMRRRQSAIKQLKLEPRFGVLVYIELIALLMTGAGYFWENVNRIGWYFYSFSPVLYGMTLTARTTKKSVVSLMKYLIVLIVAYYFYGVLVSRSLMLVPYTFFWEY